MVYVLRNDGGLARGDVLVVNAGPGAVAPVTAGRATVRIAAGDRWGLDAVAALAAFHHVRVLGRWDDAGAWWGVLVHELWDRPARVARQVRDAEAAAVALGARSPALAMVVERDVPIPVVVSDATGRFTELVFRHGEGVVRSVSATRALELVRRPPVAHGAAAAGGLVGLHRPSRAACAVLRALVAEPDPSPKSRDPRPWPIHWDGHRVVATPLPFGLRRNPCNYLIRRGVPALYPWKACYLPVDGDCELAVQATLDVCRARDLPVVAAYSGSIDPSGFRHLCLVVLVDPADRDRVADDIHDRQAELAAAAGVSAPDRHVARPHELSRLPLTPPAKPGARGGYAFLEPVSQPTVGPTVVRAITAEEAGAILRIDETAGVPAATAKAIATAPLGRHRPAGADAAYWISGMSPDVRWHLTATRGDLAAKYKNKNGNISLNETFWRVLSSCVARGATATDVYDVAVSGGAVATYVHGLGGSVTAQIKAIAREVDSYYKQRLKVAHAPTAEQRRRANADLLNGLAEAAWQALPGDLTLVQENALATLLALVARVGRLDEMSGIVRVDLGARELSEAAGADMSTLVRAAEQVAWLDRETVGTRSRDGVRDASTWVINARLLDVPQTTSRPSLERFVTVLHRSHLVHVPDFPVAARRLLVSVLEDGATAREGLRAAFGWSSAALSRAVKPLADAGLVTATRESVAPGPVGVAAAAIELGGDDRYEELVERSLAERVAADEAAAAAAEARAIAAAEREAARRRAYANETAWAATMSAAEATLATLDARALETWRQDVVPDDWASAAPIEPRLTMAGWDAADAAVPAADAADVAPVLAAAVGALATRPAPAVTAPAAPPRESVPYVLTAAGDAAAVAPVWTVAASTSPAVVREVGACLRPDRARGLGADLPPAERDAVFTWAAQVGAAWVAGVGDGFPEQGAHVARQAMRRRLADATAEEAEVLVMAAARAGRSILSPATVA